jgi:putative tryptophan/tyrosine transport system substrate-binding protein
MMERRAFIGMLGAAAVWPGSARAQPPAAPVIGFLGDASPEAMAPRVAAFRQGLDEIGYAEGRNLTIDWRSAERQPNRVRALAADLVGRRVAAIVTASDLATAAAETATSTIPIVFLSGSDPVRSGLAGRSERPSPNVTGLSWFGADLAPARLAMVRQLAPQATVIGLLIDPDFADAAQLAQAQAAADLAGLTLVVLHAGSASEIEAAFATLVARHAGALVVGASAFFAGRREQLIALAARHRIPAIYPAKEMAAAGGLASFGYSVSDAFRRAGVYTGWILKGAAPADLPILQSSKVELVINLDTAKTLGLDLPHNLLAGADELIQ